MRVLELLLLFVVASCLVTGNVLAAPQYTLNQVSVNSDFENGIGGWQSVTSNAKVVTRNWTPDPTNNPSLQRLGQKAVSLNGDGYFSQWLTIAPGTKYHAAQIKAARRPYIPFTDPLAEGWSGFGITYYDSKWNEIDDVSEEIYGVLDADPAKSYSGLVTYSVGGIVPVNAVYATLWCTNHSLKSEVAIDDFSMFSLTFTSANPKALPVLIPQSQFVPPPPQATLRPDIFIRPAEVWRVTSFGITLADRGFGPVVAGRGGGTVFQVGRSNRPVTLSQLIPAVPGKKYALTLTAGFTSKEAGIFGIDCYDRAGVKVATVSSSFKDNTATDAFGTSLEQKTTTLNILIPNNTYSTYYWVWTGQNKTVQIPSVTLDIVP